MCKTITPVPFHTDITLHTLRTLVNILFNQHISDLNCNYTFLQATNNSDTVLDFVYLFIQSNQLKADYSKFKSLVFQISCKA